MRSARGLTGTILISAHVKRAPLHKASPNQESKLSEVSQKPPILASRRLISWRARVSSKLIPLDRPISEDMLKQIIHPSTEADN